MAENMPSTPASPDKEAVANFEEASAANVAKDIINILAALDTSFGGSKTQENALPKPLCQKGKLPKLSDLKIETASKEEQRNLPVSSDKNEKDSEKPPKDPRTPKSPVKQKTTDKCSSQESVSRPSDEKPNSSTTSQAVFKIPETPVEGTTVLPSTGARPKTTMKYRPKDGLTEKEREDEALDALEMPKGLKHKLKARQKAKAMRDRECAEAAARVVSVNSYVAEEEVVNTFTGIPLHSRPRSGFEEESYMFANDYVSFVLSQRGYRWMSLHQIPHSRRPFIPLVATGMTDISDHYRPIFTRHYLMHSPKIFESLNNMQLYIFIFGESLIDGGFAFLKLAVFFVFCSELACYCMQHGEPMSVEIVSNVLAALVLLRWKHSLIENEGWIGFIRFIFDHATREKR